MRGGGGGPVITCPLPAQVGQGRPGKAGEGEGGSGGIWAYGGKLIRGNLPAINCKCYLATCYNVHVCNVMKGQAGYVIHMSRCIEPSLRQ